MRLDFILNSMMQFHCIIAILFLLAGLNSYAGGLCSKLSSCISDPNEQFDLEMASNQSDDEGDDDEEHHEDESPIIQSEEPVPVIMEASGSCGVVERRVDESGNVIAVKSIIPDLDVNSLDFALRCFYREVKFFERSREHFHPNVPQALCINRETYEIHLPFFEGSDLLEHLRQLPQGEYWCEDRVREYFLQILSALMHLRNLGYVHGDLKLENMCLDRYGRIQFIDFGLSSPRYNHFGQHLDGTQEYMCPEALMRISFSNYHRDYYAAGIILHILLTKSFPFLFENGCIQNGEWWFRLVGNPVALNKHLRKDPRISYWAANLITRLISRQNHCYSELSMILVHPFLWSNQVSGIQISAETTPAERAQIIAMIESQNLYFVETVSSLQQWLPSAEALRQIISFLFIAPLLSAPGKH